MITVGLTGQSGAGKTTVSAEFAAAGFEIINADIIARQVMEKGQPCLAETVKCFGSGILNGDGTLDRKALAEKVFSDRAQLELLNGICYPHIVGRIEKLINEYNKNNIKYVLLDAPTLFEAGAERLCDVIVTAAADTEIRIGRITARDGISRRQALDRFSKQHDIDFFRKHSDYIIENNGSVTELKERTREIIQTITEKYDNG